MTDPATAEAIASNELAVVQDSAVAPHLAAVLSAPTQFAFNEVIAHLGVVVTAPPPPNPPLGPLAAFVGNWTGKGFNTIFRPNGAQTPTPMPAPPQPPLDNVLELNLTSENLSFSPSLGRVPNRGFVQGDVFLNGVPYLQAINDITTGSPIGIHLEPGLWIAVPSTDDPAEGPTFARMASIPHGTTINAQGTAARFAGAPNIPRVDITPFPIGNPGQKIPFPSQTAANGNTNRLPQDLTAFISAGAITQAILDDPNTLLRDHNNGLHITGGTAITISTSPANPLFGGGSDNIAFLLGNAAATSQNAPAAQMNATFWIESVVHTIVVPPFHPGEPPITLRPENLSASHPAPTFAVMPTVPIVAPHPITIQTTQIQYSQVVFLNFNGLTWPHVSVATLVPAGPIAVPPTAWQ
jgi:hypothetical protein